MRLITASQIARVRACPAGQVLPWAHSSNGYAERGNEIHKFLATALLLGRDAALKDVPPQYADICSSIDLAAIAGLIGNRFESELSLAYDIATGKGRVLGTALGRSYADLGENEIAGTADIVVRTGGAVFVPDFKTGHVSLSPVSTSDQMKTLGLMAARAYGFDAATVALVYIRTDGSIYVDRHEMDALDLDAHAADLHAMVDKVRAADAVFNSGRQPDVTLGDHCKYCPALSVSCKAMTSLVRAINHEVAEINPAALTDEQKAIAWERLKQAEKVLERVRDILETHARQSPIPLPGGGYVKEVETERREIDPRIARGVLEKNYGKDVATKAAEEKITQASIKRALGNGKAGAARFAEAMDAISGAGGVTTKTAMAVKEVVE